VKDLPWDQQFHWGKNIHSDISVWQSQAQFQDNNTRPYKVGTQQYLGGQWHSNLFQEDSEVEQVTPLDNNALGDIYHSRQ